MKRGREDQEQQSPETATLLVPPDGNVLQKANTWFATAERGFQVLLPGGWEGKLCIVPEEVVLDRECSSCDGVQQVLANQFEGHWPPWPSTYVPALPGKSHQWSILCQRLATEDRQVTILAGLKVEKMPGRGALRWQLSVIGLTHARDLRLITDSTSLPKGSRATFRSGEELVSRLVVPRELLQWTDNSVHDMRSYLFSGSNDADDDFGGDFDDSADYGSSSSESKPEPEPPRPDRWEYCKRRWLTMGRTSTAHPRPQFTGNGWFYVPAPLGAGRRPMLPDESCQTNMFTLMERLGKRLAFLWQLDDWLNCPKRDPDEVFSRVMRFDSLDMFVVDRYASELLMLAVGMRGDWVGRLARAEGMLACTYFNWLPDSESRMRLLRANEVYSQAFEGQQSRTFYRRLCGEGDVYSQSRGAMGQAVAERLFQYASDNVLKRCAEWRRLLQVDPETGLARALDQCGSLGATLEQMLPEVWQMVEDLNDRHQLLDGSENDVLDETAQSPPLATTGDRTIFQE